MEGLGFPTGQATLLSLMAGGRKRRVSGGVGVLRWRKGRNRSREEDIYIKGTILVLARVLALEGNPGVHRDVPS